MNETEVLKINLLPYYPVIMWQPTDIQQTDFLG